MMTRRAAHSSAPTELDVTPTFPTATEIDRPNKETRMLNARRALKICAVLATLALIATGGWMYHRISKQAQELETHRAKEQLAKEQEKADELAKLKAERDALKAQLEAKPATTPAPTPTVTPPSSPAPATTPAAAPATDEKVATTTALAYEHKIAAGEDASLLERACSLQAKHDGKMKVIPTNAVELERSRKLNEVASNDKLPAAVDTTIKISCDLRAEALGWAKFRRTQLASAN